LFWYISHYRLYLQGVHYIDRWQFDFKKTQEEGGLQIVRLYAKEEDKFSSQKASLKTNCHSSNPNYLECFKSNPFYKDN